jgi:serine/threonine protein phosphatase PrpC
MFEATGLSDPGCIRTNNEDYYLLAPPLDLYLVADGMGGAQAGEQASKLAGDTVAEYVWKSGQMNGAVLLEAFHEANRRVLRAAEEDPNLHGMGTTLTAGWKIGEEFLVANVGDSRAYLFQNGQLEQITEDQTWVNEIGRRLGLPEETLKTHSMRHVLTMAIGVSDTLRIHSYAVPLAPGALFLLSSDGLHGVVGPEKISAILSGMGTLDEKCHTLVSEARAAGGPDNITAVLLRAGKNGK